VFAATRSRRGGLALSVALLCACTAAPAWGEVPSAYSVLNIDYAPSADRALGAQIANAGDLNADGRPDVVIGIPAVDSGRGEVLAVSALDGTTIWRAPSPTEPSDAANPLAFGSRVARLGDVAACGDQHPAGVDCGARMEADGVPEILVSALGGDVDSSAPDQGRVYVLDGKTGAIHRRLRLAAVDVPPTGNSAEFGYAIASAGDLNNDGEPEAVIGAPGYDETFDTSAPFCDDGSGLVGTCEDAGRVYVFPSAQLGGPASGAPSSDLASPLPEIRNPAPEEDTGQQDSKAERFGETVSALNATPGLLIGAPLVDLPGAPDAGAVFLANGATDAMARIDPPNPESGGHFGGGAFSPPAFGDVGGTAAGDVIVGAPSLSGGQGRAYLFDGDLGGGSTSPLSTFDDPSPVADARFGTSMARLTGDMPVVGSPFGGRAGFLHIFNSNGTLAQTICDPDHQPGGAFGASVATLGDMNGDGFDDLAVGAPGFDRSGVSNAGRVYVLTSRGPAAAGATVVCPSSGGTGEGGGDTGGDEATPPRDDTVVIARVLRRLVLRADRKRVRRNASFRLRGTLSASANRRVCQRRQKIALQRRKASGGRFQTFDVAVTRASGRFTAKQIGERTYVYRARVSQTARCMGAVSKTAKVSILRRRGSH
jgi:FG-GAP repeat